MKKLKKILLLVAFSVAFFSCQNDDDKFTGSPVGNMAIETITGTISTDVDFALPGQEINFTATLPEEFRSLVTDTVTVQATAFSVGGSTRNASVDILPGNSSGTKKITMPGGGGTFDLFYKMKLTAIALKKVVPGKHYLITSNEINIASGNSSVPTESDSKLSVNLDWENKTTPNRIRLKVERVKLTTISLTGIEGKANIKVGNTNYLSVFTSDLATTAANFVNTFAAQIQSDYNITVTSDGSDLRFAYTTETIPNISITTVPGLTAPITSVTAVGDLLVFSAINNYDLGNTVRVTGYTPPYTVFNTLASGSKILAVTPTSFSIKKPISIAEGTTLNSPASSVIMTSRHLKGDIFSEVNLTEVKRPREFYFSASKRGNASEGTSYAYTPGNYRFKIGVTSPSDLASSPLDLKYRLVLRFPNGNVKIYNGIYNGLSVDSGFKTVLLVTKNGVGDSTSYTEQFTP